jgi:hypothetical protein
MIRGIPFSYEFPFHINRGARVDVVALLTNKIRVATLAKSPSRTTAFQRNPLVCTQTRSQTQGTLF